MQHVTKQHGVETLIAHGKMAAVIREELDSRCRAVADVEPDDRPSQQSGQMMGDEAVATTNVKRLLWDKG